MRSHKDTPAPTLSYQVVSSPLKAVETGHKVRMDLIKKSKLRYQWRHRRLQFCYLRRVRDLKLGSQGSEDTVRPWKRSLIEVNGRLDSAYRHELYSRVAHSYSEIGKFSHFYHLNENPCITHMMQIQSLYQCPTMRGVAGLDFDNRGIFLVSVTRSGCLMVHDFESLYCQSKLGPGSAEDESKHVVHFSYPPGREFDVARWNPSNQNEVACTSRKHDQVLIFDISYMSPKPTEKQETQMYRRISILGNCKIPVPTWFPKSVLQTRQKLSIIGRKISRGLSDVAITSDEDSRIFSPDTLGMVHVWDRRAGVSPCIELSTDRYDSIKSIQIYVDNQTIFGAGKEGIIHIWDLRGGRNSSAFQSRKDMSQLPLASLHLAPKLQKIASLKAQSEIVPKEIHSIDVNPSSPHQLAFHLDDGWSGVLDIYKSEVTHVHCPPPAWLDGSNSSADLILRKPSWLPTSSIYVVGSMSEKGIHVLDFHPSSRSPCHVDYDEDTQRNEKRDKCNHRNKFVSLSETVTGCAAHPLNGMIVAGTQNSSLLLIAQMHCSSSSETAEGEL
ncbi:Transducin/WD40 repeat-like superfamily protein [Arabidopsis thaliana]|uniref:Transducin/WD40 repeat-like superfamily protein n=1 Tax=Arabidopsis thaliana TaxID=3702 RepID=F4K107_ARATH|nr:Transducin/WD40 repeat-like superfamily protein [Arabidopsis thaliana]AED91831.1 Transducin/WD40 repeat-like superfamily protein [Arabidopsis thaliana]|eukprot:NP_001190298.1 Transducin/WD40 repeat-like superfamily protein [Arabidopsis thaliana]